jgi:hypothetical protein
MAMIEDKIVYPEKPDRLVGSKNDGNGEGIEFSMKQKKPMSEDKMPIISDAYVKRYKEYR